MAEGVDTLSNSLENISLSSTPEERDALEAALNLPDDHAMIPDDMVKKMKRREEEKRGKEDREKRREEEKRAKEDREKTRQKEERDRRKREETDSDKERRKGDKRHGSEEKKDSTRKRKAEERPTRSYNPQDRRITGITYDFS